MVGQIRLEWNTLLPYMEQIAAATQQKVELANNNEITMETTVGVTGK